MNVKPWRNLGILITEANFGRGSSREHAPWALLDFGIRCVIAPSFPDIFFNNCFKNGILPIVLPTALVDKLISLASSPATARLVIDLPNQSIGLHDGVKLTFEIDAGRKVDLINGLAEIDRSLESEQCIADFEARHRAAQPWLRDIDPSFFAKE
jgi:3-isopropylmalate/(R)-2-methylmalate dehydratase small subunit